MGAWQVYETIVDADCPQQEEFEIVRCVGHQHIGARCITLFNAETNEKICQSCPVYGKKEGALFCDSVHRSRVHAQALAMCVRRGGCHLAWLSIPTPWGMSTPELGCSWLHGV